MTQRPRNGDEFTERYQSNIKIEGAGMPNVVMHCPCPFCGAEDYIVARIIDMEEVIQRDATCRECKRVGRTLLDRDSAGTKCEFVQTGGEAPPSYLIPAPRFMKMPQYG